MFWDTVAVLEPSAVAARRENYFKPMTRPGEMRDVFTKVGLVDVTETALMLRMDYADFEDFWRPHAEGEGAQGKYLMTLDPSARGGIEQALRAAYEAGEADGPRSFVAVAWACRGIVPG
jgi:hypothetical protein